MSCREALVVSKVEGYEPPVLEQQRGEVSAIGDVVGEDRFDGLNVVDVFERKLFIDPRNLALRESYVGLQRNLLI